MDKDIILHTPVLLDDVITYLDLKKGMVIADCTVGLAGHASEFLRKVGGDGFVIGIDRDMEALEEARRRLHKVSGRFRLFKSNFRDIDLIFEKAGIKKIDGALFDFGVSSFQLSQPERGFSIKHDGPLDMRMDRDETITASDVVNSCTKDELISIFRRFGEERFAHKIAQKIVEARRSGRIKSTKALAEIATEALPYRFRFRRIHPATKIFMAIRIAVNKEIESIEEGLKNIIPYLAPGARMCVISFHSIEDRIVKNLFKAYSKSGMLKIITKKPVVPAQSEASKNPRARSAKLRVAERVK